MSICTYTLNGELLATGMPEIKQWLFNGGLEQLLPKENAPKLIGRVDSGAMVNELQGNTQNDMVALASKSGSFGTNSNDIRFSRAFEDDKAELESILSDGKLPPKKWFNTDALITNMVDSSHPLRVWARSLPDQVTAGRMLNDFDRATNIKQVIEKRAGIKFKRSIAGAINKFAKDNGIKFNVALDAIGNWASMRYALESGQSFKEYNNADLTRLKTALENKFGKANLEQAIQPTLDMNQWRLEHLDDKHGKLSGKALTDLQTPNYVPLLSEHGISDSYTEFEESAKYGGFEDFRDSLKGIYKAIATDIKATNPSLSDAEINAQIKDEYGISSKKGVVSITDPEAQNAMTDLSDERVPSILKPFAAITKFQSIMVIPLMAGFAPTNMVRDVGERSENLRTRVIPGYETTVNMNSVANQGILRATGLLRNIKQIMGVLAEGTTLEKRFAPDNSDQDVKDFREFLKEGGSSTYGDYIASNKQDLSKELSKLGGNFEKVKDWVMLWNNAFEMISGLAMYQSMKAAGIDSKSAAATSLNLMNFGKRGRVMSPLRSLFMFAQPIATGGYQMAKTLSTKRGQLRLAAYTAAAMVLYSLLRSIDGDDDDKLGYNRMDEQSNFALYRGIPIPLGDGEYFYIPVGFGMQQLAWANGVNFVRTAMGRMTIEEMMGESAIGWVKSVAPVAPAEGSMMKNPAVYIAQTFTPQAVKPIMNVALDVNAFMSPLTNSRYEKTDTAKALQGRPNTPKEYKEMAQMLGNVGIDMYPEQLRELMRGYGAGLFNEVIKYTIENPAKEERGLNYVSPLIDRWYKVSNDDQIKQKLYYNARDKMNEASVIKNNGGELTEEETQLAKLGETLKKKEASTRSKYAAATKAEKAGHEQRAANIRKVGDRMRDNYMNFAFDEIKRIEED